MDGNSICRCLWPQLICVSVSACGGSQDLCEWAAKQTQSLALFCGADGGPDELKSERAQQKLEVAITGDTLGVTLAYILLSRITSLSHLNSVSFQHAPVGDCLSRFDIP